MIKSKLSIVLFLLCMYHFSTAQNVPILSYDVNSYGQAQLEIDGDANKYYVLTAQHQPGLTYESITSMTMGIDGTMYVSEPLAAFPVTSYKITAHSIVSPIDTDRDGVDDITEFNDLPTQAPLNFAAPIPFIDGTTSIDSYETYSDLAVVNNNIPWAQFLNNQEFAKFVIVNQDSDNPEVYFVNSNTHYIHADFINTLNLNNSDVTVTGEIVYNPNEILPTGVIGTYSFNYSFGNSYPFSHTQRTFELLAANMPYLQNNFKHFIGDGGENAYENIHKNDFVGSRITVELESDVFADVDFLPFHQAEGFGYFRHMQLDENPGSRDIVIYDVLPNSLPRVGGIITSVIQTPLSHVNLRAIQDNVPNAYIREPLAVDSISSLLGKYIYYKVEQDRYEIREATLEEVNEWFDKLRPTEEQIPDRDLSQTEILPLDDINFNMSTAFGAKCSNVATMRTFGFPEGTIPDGFGIPFYYYDEFMKFNGFYQKVEDMINEPMFITDLETRIEALSDFRKEIKAAIMPQWMLDDLQDMHDAFPEGTAVRVRSSTNNEDLPGFSGAGLYTSKTQHLDEGHISKSVKQVYASIWNFRAFEERDFYRVDHYIAAMGLLCHPNYQEEKSNGVGVSLDPIYSTENTFYLNTQVGESLITNPDENSIPEEILLNEDPAEGYFVLRNSNLVPNGELVMSEAYLDLMREYLKVIHDEFEILYNVVGAEGFGMDIEYKVTIDDQMIIKQARPWVSFWADIKSNFDLAVEEISNPQSSSTLGDAELITAKIANRGLRNMKDFEISLFVEGQVVETMLITDELVSQSDAEYQFTLPQDLSAIGDYQIGAAVSHPSDGYSTNDTLQTSISMLHTLEGSITAQLESIKCGSVLEILATVKNLGEATFSNTEIEVLSNGLVVETINYDFGIPYSEEVDILITVTENLQPTDNVITLNLANVNNQQDAVLDNNMSSIMTDLDNNFTYITLVINADDYPEETSWTLYNTTTDELVESGSLTSTTEIFTQEICVTDNSCFSFLMNDSYNDGICCSYGMGNFSLLDANGETIVYNNGDFGAQAEEIFCVGENACMLTAEITVNNASTNQVADGSLSIQAFSGTAPYEYSIDGGVTFVSTTIFDNLPSGDYMVVVRDAADPMCIYEELVTIDSDITISVDDLSPSNIKVYPNPTSGNFVIELDQNFALAGILNIQVYDNLGKLVNTTSISELESKATISIEEYPAGTYIAKCFNQDFEKYFKVIKL